MKCYFVRAESATEAITIARKYATEFEALVVFDVAPGEWGVRAFEAKPEIPNQQDSATKRYLLFVGHFYYASGGFNDFAGDFDTVDLAEGFLVDADSDDWDWWHIFDTKENVIAKKSEQQAHGSCDQPDEALRLFPDEEGI